MSLWDLPLAELERYSPHVVEPSDFDAFWAGTLAEARERELAVQSELVDSGLTTIRTWDVTYAGFGGHPIRAWLHVPAGAERPLPTVVQYQGYGGGRGLAHECILWAAAGFAHLVMDTRGQGSAWCAGDTPDPVGSDPAQPGQMTRGIRAPSEHYYRRVFTDAVRAIEAVRTFEVVDAERVAVFGASQGGGIALAAGALMPDVAAVMTDVPFLCHIARGVEQTDSDPYAEVQRYLRVHRGARDQVFATLSYFDGVNFARRAVTPALFSVGLQDLTCPPSTVYAAYNAYSASKEIAVYPDNDHEGGGAVHQVAQLHWLHDRLS